MKKAAQLDWTDLQEIAKMRGVGELVAAVPANTDPCSSESEHEPASHSPGCQAAKASQSATLEKQTSPHCPGRSGSPEKELDMTWDRCNRRCTNCLESVDVSYGLHFSS